MSKLPPSPSVWPRLVAGLMTLWLLPLAQPSQAQAPGSDAYAKAQLVLAFARFVEWPQDVLPGGGGSPLNVCVTHDSPALEAAFQQLAVGAATSRTVVPLFNVTGEAARACHVWFIDKSANSSLESRTLDAAEASLTMGSSDGFASRGGMVEIVIVNDGLRFDVNLPAVHAAGLNVRPNALRLARNVRQTR